MYDESRHTWTARAADFVAVVRVMTAPKPAMLTESRRRCAAVI
jgi:hypothetical protein